jgi:phage terminase large subunit
MPIKLNSLFKPLYTSKKRYFFLTGGRGSLKSSTVHDFIVRLTYQSGHGVLFTRYTMTAAEKSIIPELETTLKRLGVYNDFHITKTTVTNKKTGSFIYFSGIKTSSGDQTGRLKSIANITTWVIEEGEDFTNEETFETIDDSIRTTTRQNRVIWIQNPTTKEHFIYKKWIKQNSKKIKVGEFDVTVSTNPDVEHIHTTYKIAERLGYLSASFLRKAEKAREQMLEDIAQARAEHYGTVDELAVKIRKIKQTSRYYYKYIGGWLEQAPGAIFTNWIEGEFDDNLPYCYGLDYGFTNPLALVKVAVDHYLKRVYLRYVIYEPGISDIPARLQKENILKRDLIVADTNEGRTTARIRKKKYNIQPARKNKVSEDIRELKNYTFVIEPDDANAKREFNNYAWDDERAEIPIKDNDHGIDATRYAFNRLTKPKTKGIRRAN